MKDKLKNILADEKKRLTLILFIVTFIIITSVILIVVIFYTKEEKVENSSTTTQTTLKKKDIFKGYQKYEFNPDYQAKYDYQSRYEFIYAEKEDKEIIYTHKDNVELNYELTLKDGAIIFSEQRYNNELQAYEYTGKTSSYKAENKITDYLVVPTCEQDTFSIIAQDASGNGYKYTSSENDGISEIISNFKKIKTISKIKKIGYYTGNNNPNTTCNDYELIYLDSSNHIRYFDGKSSLFYDDAYYRYIGNKDYDNHVYVLKDGLMKYDIGNTNTNLGDGKYHLMYRGSFYTINNNQENLYIIDDNGYLYKIEDFKEDSPVIIKRVTNNTIKRLGIRSITDENHFATDRSNILIEFSDDEILEITEIYEFELLNG